MTIFVSKTCWQADERQIPGSPSSQGRFTALVQKGLRGYELWPMPFPSQPPKAP